jgi:hypothetical protein
MNTAQIAQAITSGTFSISEIDSLIQAIKYARARVSHAAIHQLRVGDNVSFQGRGGREVTGVVMKIAIKNVTVKTIEGNWRVSAAFLTRIADEEEMA